MATLAAIPFKMACGLIESGETRGTGFLVRSDAVLTCYHIVRDAKETVRVQFEQETYDARVARVDAENDCALLRLLSPIRHILPLRLGSAPPQLGTPWEAYGFPSATLESGLLIAGDVQDPSGRDMTRRPAMQLYSRQLTAGAHPQGMSGSPVVAGGVVVGQLRQIVPDEQGGGQFGTLYACPSEILAQLLPEGTPATANPYRGLSAFQADEAHMFFGRAELTAKLWQRYKTLTENPAATRLLTILGPSGSGKSSIARAGLLAALMSRPIPGPQAVRIAASNPGEYPFRALALTLIPSLVDQYAAPDLSAQRKLIDDLRQPNRRGEFDGVTLWAANQPNAVAAPLVLLVDQFEEVYTLCADKEERDAFVGALLNAARDSARHVSVIITLRSDFLNETQRHHPELTRLIAEQSVIVAPMSPDELRQAIAEPAARTGRPIDEATIELLLAQSRGCDGALPLLEFALTHIWEGMLKGGEPGATLRKIGGVGGALASKAHGIYNTLSEREQATARRALVRLVQLRDGIPDTRRRVFLRDLCGHGETESEVLAVLRRFATDNARLVTLSAEGIDPAAEVTHEALFEHWADLNRWINEGRADRRFHDRVVEAARLWDDAGRATGRLWRLPDLELLRAYQRRYPQDLSPLQEAFLSAAERQQKYEQLMMWGGILTVLAALFAAAGIYAAKEQQRANEAAESMKQIHQQLVSTYVEHGRQLLVDKQSPIEALPWLNRAQLQGSPDPILPDLMRVAMWTLDATQVVLVGHREIVNSAAYSPDNHYIVTASYDGTARIWDAETGRHVLLIGAHTNTVIRAIYSPDGRRIVTASLDKTARVLDVNTRQFVAELKGHRDGLNDVTFSPDGVHIATASADKTARVWDANTGQLVVELKGHKDSVRNITYSPDGQRIVTASADKTARVWNAETGQLILELKGHENDVLLASYNPSGHNIATASADKTARIWNAETGQLVVELKGHERDLSSIAYSPDGRRVVTASADRTARVWDAETGRLVVELKGHGDSLRTANYSPDSRRIVTASMDNSARVWDAERGHLLAIFKGHRAGVTSAVYSLDGHRIATTSWDQTARVWDAQISPILAELKGHGNSVNTAMYSPNGRRLVTASVDKTAGVWDAETGRLIIELKGHGDSVRSARYSPDGRRVVTASWDNTARVWDAETGAVIVELKGHEAGVVNAAYSPDGHRIVTASWDNTARVWDAETGSVIVELKGHSSHVTSAAYSPDGRYIVTTSWDKMPRVWEAQSGRFVAALMGHWGPVWSATYSPDARYILTTGMDKTARVWDAETGRLSFTLNGHVDSVDDGAYSPDGQRIVTASRDNTARVWDAGTGRLISSLEGHDNIVNGAAYSPDGRRIVTASVDHTVRVWDVSRETRAPEQIHQLIRCYAAVGFVPDDSNILATTGPHPAECVNMPRHRP